MVCLEAAMPLPAGGRYRVKTTESGKKVRLHFDKAGQVNEAKNLATGKTHTPQEFAADHKQAGPPKGLRSLL